MDWDDCAMSEPGEIVHKSAAHHVRSSGKKCESVLVLGPALFVNFFARSELQQESRSHQSGAQVAPSHRVREIKQWDAAIEAISQFYGSH